MKKRSKSLSLSDKLIQRLSKILKEERRISLSTSPTANNSELPNFSSLVERLLWEAIEKES